ncbi:MAG: QueT transporter family protein [Desulfurococcaceae archaeon]|jgi:uncharacterized membrane protein|nr:QueT transporter family protein [Desulfurococcaceae archaeon]
MEFISMRSINAIILAAVYAILVLVLPGLSYGPLQVRIADVLSPLPYVMGFESVIGLTLGTLIANVFSPYGIWDMIIGTLCTFTYALIDWFLGKLIGYKKWMLIVIATVNSIIVGFYIGVLLLGIIGGGGNLTYLFILLTSESFISMSIGSLILVPTIRKYYKVFK